MNLKTKSIALVSLCFVIIVCFSYVLLQILERDIRTGLASMYAGEQVDFNRTRIRSPLSRELGLALKLADSKVIRNWALNEADPELRESAMAELEDHRRFFSDQSFFFALRESGHYYYNDKDNHYLGAELRYTLDPDSAEDQWFFRTLNNPRGYTLNVDFDEKLKVTKVWINVVVRVDDRPVGVIGTGLDLSEFIAAVVTSEQAGVSSIIIEEGGAIQAHNNQQLIDFRTLSKPESERKTIFQLLDSAADVTRLQKSIARLKAGQQKAEILTLRINGTEYLAGVGAVTDIGWYNITLLETASIIGARQILPFTLLLFTALFLLSVALITLLNRFVLNRIYRLNDLMRKFSRGEEIGFPTATSRDEVGGLEKSFAQMTVALREHAHTLEQKVADRTKELAEKNLQLKQALSEIKVLSGLLPICMYCKEIRDDKGAWTRLENYIEEHSDAQFTHSLCDKCLAEKFPEQVEKLKEERRLAAEQKSQPAG
jgi:HAMP domain-containing protein